MNISAALYCRLSKDDLSFGESSSISTQKMILKKYAQMKSWTITLYMLMIAGLGQTSAAQASSG